MICSFCLRDDGHDFLCPYYEPPKPLFYCSVCGDGIINGEEYIENNNGKHVHYNCVWSTSMLLKFLGVDVKIMEENDD